MNETKSPLFCANNCEPFGYCTRMAEDQYLTIVTNRTTNLTSMITEPGCIQCECPLNVAGACCEFGPYSFPINQALTNYTLISPNEPFPYLEISNVTCQSNATIEECLCEQFGFQPQNCAPNREFCNNCNKIGTKYCSFNLSFIDEIQGKSPCVCKENFTGVYCETKLPEACAKNECVCNKKKNRCRNGGLCFYNGTGEYLCRCPAGYTGRDCAKPTACAQNPCQHGGICSEDYGKDSKSNYTCDCLDIWAGEKCEVFNACARNPCKNDAKCISTGHNTYECQCPPGFEGKHCENRINFCRPNPCNYKATCVNYATDYTCKCPPGTSGKNCEINPDDCFDNSTVPIGVSVKRSNKCQKVDENATCIDGFNAYKCVCSPDFTGRNCDLTLLSWSLLQHFPKPEDPNLVQFVDMILADPSIIPEIVPFFVTNWTTDNQTAISWDHDDLFIWASYQGTELNITAEMTKLYDPILGNCYTFNADGSPIAYQVDDAGQDYGFQALMRVREDEYLPWTKTAALQVFINGQDEPTFSDSQRYFAAPGTASQFVISSSTYSRLSGKYGACINKTSEVHTYYYPGKYTNDGCVLSCYQNIVHLYCGCTDPRYPGINGVKVCTIAKGNCVLNVTAHLGDPSTWKFCDCPASCNDTKYNVLWYSGDFTLDPVECCGSSSCVEEFNDRALISVFYGKNAQYSFEETPAMDLNKYISLFGGVTGIIAGFCIITVVDFSFLLYRILLTFCTNESVTLEDVGVQAEDEDEILFQ
ncbi:amiloride-sensitive sodium channel domain-containing protein [Ditylenchus destructor]|nr:amiloride-sensitive sodium channel domain-containing protein [Ditylenchus destructor]